jgi:excisionase family DNA binding protein
LCPPQLEAGIFFELPDEALEEASMTTTADSREFLTVKEVAARHRTTSATVYQWIAEKRFPESVVLRLGRKILIHRKNLEEFEAQGGELVKKVIRNGATYMKLDTTTLQQRTEVEETPWNTKTTKQ